MSYYEDCMKQLKIVLSRNGNDEIKSIYEEKLKKVFMGIYILNYISNRIELRRFFNCDYYNICFSCLMESFSLILNNYPRGASLILRSSLENGIKYIMKTLDINNDYIINDRIYTENKKNLENMINKRYTGFLKREGISLNSKMENLYKELSGISHSLVPASKNNITNYFSDIGIVNRNSVSIVFEKFLMLLRYLFCFCIIICISSFKNWDSYDLRKIMKMIFGTSTTETYLRNIYK